MRLSKILGLSVALLGLVSAQEVMKPKIMVIATANPGMDEQRDDEAQALIEQTLQELGFQTIDSSQLGSVKEVDDALNAGDKEKILSLRTRFGCEVLIIVKYDKQFVTGGSDPRAMWWYVFNGKAIRTDTAQQIVSRSTKSPRPRKSFNHFVDTAQIFASEMGEKVEKAWQREATLGLQIQLVVSQGDAVAFMQLNESLRGLRTVSSCVQRRFQRDTCEYEVQYMGSKDQFIVDLSTLTNPSLQVTGFEANRVDAIVTNAPPPPVDNTAPVVKITSPADGRFLTTSRINVMGTVDDPTVRSVTINGVNATVTGTNFTAWVDLPVQGSNTVEAVAVDPAGNRGSDRVTLTLDSTPPEVTIVAPQNGRNLTNARVNVGIRVTGDDVARVEVNGVPAELFRAPDTYKATLVLNEGKNVEIRAVAYDQAGNSGSDRILVNVDTTPPELDGKVTVIVSGKVDDPGYKVTVNGKLVTVQPDGTWSTTVDISQTKIVTIVAEDEFGNQTVKKLDYGK